MSGRPVSPSSNHPSNREFSALGVGDIVAGRYKLEKCIGEGAMGTVWRARHLQLESAVALKLMTPEVAKLPESLARFLQEARSAARLSSQHVVKVYDYGVQEKSPYLVMELLQGESLRERLDREGRLPLETVRTLICHCCRALTKAHSAGIVHRDLKPENLFLVDEEEPLIKVLDFGIAKVSDALAGPVASHTRTGAVLGTPYYMSPEQVRGSKNLDHRADLWSLAVIAYEALTGYLPFESESFGDLVLKICTEAPTLPSSLGNVPPGFDDWIRTGLSTDPAARFLSAEALCRAFEGCFDDEPIELVEIIEPREPPLNRKRELEQSATERPPAELGQAAPVSLVDVTAAHTVRAPLPSGRQLWRFAALPLVALAAWLVFSPRTSEVSNNAEQLPNGRNAAGPLPIIKELPPPPLPSSPKAEQSSEELTAPSNKVQVKGHSGPETTTRNTRTKPSKVKKNRRNKSRRRAKTKARRAKRRSPRSSRRATPKPVDLFSQPD